MLALYATGFIITFLTVTLIGQDEPDVFDTAMFCAVLWPVIVAVVVLALLGSGLAQLADYVAERRER